MQVDRLEWQPVSGAPPPPCCGLLVSWWGQASYNSLMVPLPPPPSSSFAPVTAVFAVHCSAKHFERYMQDMGFLEMTLLRGTTLPGPDDVANRTLGKLSISVATLAVDCPIHGSYPIFANGQRLIGSLTLGIAVVFPTDQAELGYPGGVAPFFPAARGGGKPRMVSSFERNEAIASADQTLPLYPPTPPPKARQGGPLTGVGVGAPNRSLSANDMGACTEPSLGSGRDSTWTGTSADSHLSPKKQIGPTVSPRVHLAESPTDPKSSDLDSPGRVEEINPLAVVQGGDALDLPSTMSKCARTTRLGRPTDPGEVAFCTLGPIVTDGCHLSTSKVTAPLEGNQIDFPPAFEKRARDDENAKEFPKGDPTSLHAVEVTGTDKNKPGDDHKMEELFEKLGKEKTSSARSRRSPPSKVGSLAKGGGLSDLLALPDFAKSPQKENADQLNNITTVKFGTLLPEAMPFENRHSPLNPRADLGFDPGGGQGYPHPSSFKYSRTVKSNPRANLDADRACDNIFGAFKARMEPRAVAPRPLGPEIFAAPVEEAARRGLRGPGPPPPSVMDDISKLIKRAEAFRDALRTSEFFNMSSVTSLNVPSAESMSRNSGPLCGRENHSIAKLLENILEAGEKDAEAERVAAQDLLEEDVDDLDDEVRASDVAEAALLEAFFVDDFKNNAGPLDDGIPDMTWREASFRSVQNTMTNYGLNGLDDELYKTDLGFETQRAWHYRRSVDGEPRYEPRLAEFLEQSQGQVLALQLAIGKLVLCGPVVRDLVDLDAGPSGRPEARPRLAACVCLLTVSFPALAPPYSAEQRISISPVRLGPREAVFDHQSRMRWSLPPCALQAWPCQDLRVAVSLTWHRLDSLECVGEVLLDRVIGSMPGAYQTSLALALAPSDVPYRRISSCSPYRRRRLKICETQRLGPRVENQTGARRNRSGSSWGFSSSLGRDPVARVDITLQLTDDRHVSPNTHERMEEVDRGVRGPFRIERTKLSPPRLLRSAPALAIPLDLWLHVIVQDAHNCLGGAVGGRWWPCPASVKPQSARLLLVVKSGPQFACRVPYPLSLGLQTDDKQGGASNAVLRAPSEPSEKKAVMFIEVWRDGELAKDYPGGLGALVGLVKVPLRLPDLPSTVEDFRRIRDKGGEVAADGCYAVRDPRKYTISGSVAILVTLGLEYQMRRLLRANRAAMIIQRHVRAFLKGRHGDNSIEITRFWGRKKRRNETRGHKWR